MSARLAIAVVVILAVVAALVIAADRPSPPPVVTSPVVTSKAPLVATLYGVDEPVGLMVTTGGWAYCEQMRPVARKTHYSLLCGRYELDGYTGPGLRHERHLDWGDPAYLARLADTVAAVSRDVGGKLVLIGVSYSGFGVATLAAHHPELRPDQLIVIDSYFDLGPRRRLLPNSHETAVEIDKEVGTSPAALRRRTPDPAALARLVRSGTRLTVVWSISDVEQRRFKGATCGREASAATLARVARMLREPVAAWVTRSRHGGDLWRHGASIVRGSPPGRMIVFPASGIVPKGSFCAP